MGSAIESVLDYRSSIGALLDDPSDFYEHKPPPKFETSEAFRRVVSSIHKGPDRPATFCKEAENSSHSVKERSILLHFGGATSSDDATFALSAFGASEDCLEKQSDESETVARLRIINANNKAGLLIRDGHDFTTAWRLLRQVMKLDPGYKLMSGTEVARFFINGLETTRLLGKSKESADFADQVLLYIRNHFGTIPIEQRPQLFAKLALFFRDSFDDQGWLMHLEALFQMNETYLKKEPIRSDSKPLMVEKLESSGLELDTLLVIAHLEASDRVTYQDKKKLFVENHKNDLQYLEDWGHILLEEGLHAQTPNKDRKILLQEVLDVHEKEGHDFHLAEARVRILAEYPAFYDDELARQEALVSSWRVIEKALGINMIQSTIERIESVRGAVEQVSQSVAEQIKSGNSKVLQTALAQFVAEQTSDFSELTQFLGQAVLNTFPANNTTEFATALNETFRKTGLAVYKQDEVTVDEMEKSLENFIDDEGKIQSGESLSPTQLADLGITSIEVVEAISTREGPPLVLTALQTKTIQIQNYYLEPGSPPQAFRQVVALPLESGRVAYLKIKDGEPINERTIRLLHGLLGNDDELIFGSDTVKEYLRPKNLKLRAMSPEEFAAARWKHNSLEDGLNDIHHKESGVRFLKKGIVKWFVLEDELTGEPLAFLSTNPVDKGNYAFIIGDFPDNAEECEELIKENTGQVVKLKKSDKKEESGVILEVTNMGVTRRLFSTATMRAHYAHTAEYIRDKMPEHDPAKVLSTMQKPLVRKISQSLPVDIVPIGGEDFRFDPEIAMKNLRARGPANGIDNPEDEGPYVGRGEPQGWLMFTASMLKFPRGIPSPLHA